MLIFQKGPNTILHRNCWAVTFIFHNVKSAFQESFLNKEQTSRKSCYRVDANSTVLLFVRSGIDFNLK